MTEDNFSGNTTDKPARPHRRPLPSEVLTFTEMDAKGRAIATRAGGSKAAAFCVAPGDTAECLIGGKKKGVRESWLLNVIKPAPGRTSPRCPHFGLCGGCALQHLDYAKQLELKAVPIRDRLLSLCPTAQYLPPYAAPAPWHYRSKVEFSFLGDDIGFNRKGRFDKAVNVKDCFIGPPCGAIVLSCVRAWKNKFSLPGWNPRANTGFLRYLIIRQSTSNGQFLVAIVTTSPTGAQTQALQELATLLSELGAQGVVHVVHNSPAAAVKAESSEVLAGRDCIEERLGDLTFDLSWRSFFQSNPPAFYAMLQEINSWIADHDRILDLYCGVGTIGLSLKGELTGVEAVPEAIEDARRNAIKAGREATFHCGNSEDWPNLDCDLLILDPPRSGCHPKLIKRLPAEGPERILYISCNPLLFAEEYNTISQYYTIERFRLFDFFPQTPHCEAVSLLVRN